MMTMSYLSATLSFGVVDTPLVSTSLLRPSAVTSSSSSRVVVDARVLTGLNNFLQLCGPCKLSSVPSPTSSPASPGEPAGAGRTSYVSNVDGNVTLSSELEAIVIIDNFVFRHSRSQSQMGSTHLKMWIRAPV